MARAAKLVKNHEGKLVSAKSKTGDPKCSAAVSAWVHGRKEGNVAAEVFKTLAACRKQAGQNKKAQSLQNAGKLAEGRGTWQRSEQARQLVAKRAAGRPGPADGEMFRPLGKGQLGGIAGKPSDTSAPSAAVAKAKAAVAASKPAAPKPAKSPAATKPPKPTAAPKPTAGPTLRQQADAHRAAKGTDADRARATLARAVGRYGDALKAHGKLAESPMGALKPKYRKEREAQSARQVRTMERMGKAHAKAMGHIPSSPPPKAAPVAAVLAHAKAVHAANPGPAMTTHNPHATNATAPAAGGFGPADLRAALTRAHQGKIDDRQSDPREIARLSGRPLPEVEATLRDLGRKGAVSFDHASPERIAMAKGYQTFSVDHEGKAYVGFRVDRPARFHAATAETTVTTRTANLAAAPPMPVPLPIGKAGRTESREGRLEGLVGRLRAKVSKGPAPTADPATHTDHAPGHVGNLDTGLIHVDAERFQYKIGAGANGSVGSLDGVEHYDPDFGGSLQVWKDHADGKVYVVNGHNRLDLAKRSGAGRIQVRFIEAADHHEARAKGALTNIAEGRGTALDAAKFLRGDGKRAPLTREDIAARGIPIREKVATDGLALSRLDDHAFRRVTSGEMSPERGVLIGGSGLEHHEQRALLGDLDKMSKRRGGDVSNAALREMIDNARAAKSVTRTTKTLFGDDEETVSLAVHKGQLQATIKDRLAKEKRLFGIVAKSRHAEDLARAGNSINTAESGKVSHEAAVTLHAFDSLKNLSGPVSRRLNDAAERIHNGEDKKKVTDETYRGILKELPEMLRGSQVFAP